MSGMTMRERILAVVEGREHDRVPFVQYNNLAAPNREIWSVVGRENMGLLKWCSVCRSTHPNCGVETREFERDGLRGRRSVLHTREGDLVEERMFEPAYGTGSIRKHYVTEPADYRALMAWFRDAVIEPDHEGLAATREELGDDGLPHCSIGRTPYQQLWVEWVALDDLCLHLVDEPDLLAECMGLMTRNLRRVFEIVRTMPVPYIVFGDNITAPVIGEAFFRRYCVPCYRELADMMSERGRRVFVHMDGDLRPLWEAIGDSGVGGLDSLSPPPDNDTSAGEAHALWPEMRLLVNFPSSVHLGEPDDIYAAAMAMLEEAGHSGRLQIQISENVPSGVWRRSFPEIIRAINDFGRPRFDC